MRTDGRVGTCDGILASAADGLSFEKYGIIIDSWRVACDEFRFGDDCCRDARDD